MNLGIGLSLTSFQRVPTVPLEDPDAAIAALFGSGEVGAWYDPSDSTTVFQDANGTTPAGVGDPVGLILDKSKGLTLGGELWPGASITVEAGWIDNGDGSFTGSTAEQRIYATAGITQNRLYEYSLTVTAYTSGDVLAGSGGSFSSLNISGPGTYTVYKYQFAVSGGAAVFDGSSFTGTISNLSVKELPGNHATQTTSAARPILQQSGATPVLSGTELVTNGTFDTDTDWTKGTGWTIAGGVANHAPGSASNLDQNNVVTGGKWYRFTVDATASGGTWALQLAGGTTTTVGSSLSSGSYSFVAQANATNTILRVYAGALTDLTIDNISVQEVTSWSGGLRYLDFDGVDDWMGDVVFSSPIPVPMTYSIAAQWSGNGSSPSNEYLLDSTNSNRHAIYKNTSNIINVFVGTNVPLSPSTTLGADELLTIDVQGPSISSIRRNGAVAQSGLSLNASLSQFRLANYLAGSGTGVYYLDGRIYGMVLTSRTLTAAEITDLESYLAAKSGVTLP